MEKDLHFDVVIVGGGPAGSSAAMAAAQSRVRVALLEKEESIAHTVRTSGVTWISDAQYFGIPPDCYNPVQNYSFCSPNNEATITDSTPRAAVLDVRKTYRWLAEQAQNKGAEIFLNTQVTDITKNQKGVISGVVAKTASSERIFHAKVVIDASGFQSVVAKMTGFETGWKRFGAGAEYEMHAQNADPDTWWLMVGEEYSPAGYAWIFPLGGDRVRIGVGIGKPESSVDPAQRLDEIIEKKTGPIAKLGKLTMIESHFGLIPNDGLSRKTVHDGLILVGDSAGQANPLVLEGIRYAIRFGRVAGSVTGDAVKKDDTSQAVLSKYEDAWRIAIQSKIGSAKKVQDRWLELTDAQWDREIDIIKELSSEEFVDFIKADFGLASTIKLAIHHPKAAVRQLFNMVRDATGS